MDVNLNIFKIAMAPNSLSPEICVYVVLTNNQSDNYHGVTVMGNRGDSAVHTPRCSVISLPHRYRHEVIAISAPTSVTAQGSRLTFFSVRIFLRGIKYILFQSCLFYFIFIERGIEGEREGEKLRCVREKHWSVTACMHPSQGLDCNLGTCPDQQATCTLQDDAQVTEPWQSGQELPILEDSDELAQTSKTLSGGDSVALFTQLSMYLGGILSSGWGHDAKNRHSSWSYKGLPSKRDTGDQVMTHTNV